MARIRELLIGIGTSKQSDIVTASAGIVRLNKLNADLVNPKLNTESDAQEIGKGHEFATQVFKSHWEVAGKLEKYLTSQFAAWAICFGLGKVVKTGSAPYTYTVTPMDPVNDGLELPYFTMVEQIRPGGSALIDNAYLGCALKSWTISCNSGVGRQSTKITADFVGSGKQTSPSGITLPAPTPEVQLPVGSLTLAINGITDYVTAKNIVSLEAGWDNNFQIQDGYFPGSGVQDGAQVMGRIEIGDRVPHLRVVARLAAGSRELAALKALTTGTAVVGLTADANNSLTLTYQKVAFQTVEVGDTNGTITVATTVACEYDSTNGVLSAQLVTPLSVAI